MNRRAAWTLALATVMAVALPARAITPIPAEVWAAPYVRIAEMPGGADRTLQLRGANNALDGHVGQARGVALPFPFSTYDAGPFTKFNVGAKGYITFGDDASRADAKRDEAYLLLTSGVPYSLIAAWWGDHRCDPEASVLTKTIGTSPNRQFVIEWKDCSARLGERGSDTNFAAQIWLLEGSNAIRVKYGDAIAQKSSVWNSVSWGLKGAVGTGSLGPDIKGSFGSDNLGVCLPTRPLNATKPECGVDHFPTQTVIQYGRSKGHDLTARLEPGEARIDGAHIEFDAEVKLLNVGANDAPAPKVDLYLTRSPRSQLTSGDVLYAGTHSETRTVPRGGSVSFLAPVQVDGVENGMYHVCVNIDPDEVNGEIDRTNNWVCSRGRVKVGPDLTGTISSPAKGSPGEELNLTVKLRNDGNAPAGTFRFLVRLNPTQSTPGAYAEELLSDWGPALNAGAEVTRNVQVRLPPYIRAESYIIELEVDPDHEIDDANRANNTVRASQEMASRQPSLRITSPGYELRLPEGCFYGEPLELTMRICNQGEFEARGYFPGVVMSKDGYISISEDVPAASYPPFCGTPGSWNHQPCEAIQGKSPICAFDHCRIECVQSSDCPSGLSCQEDRQLGMHLNRSGVKSCGNYLPSTSRPVAERCNNLTMSGRIPLVAQDQIPYDDNQQFFVLIDDVTHSLSQPFPDMITLEPVQCRRALVDLHAQGLNAPMRMRAGQEVPLTSSIRNLGFTNRYPESPNRPDRQTFSYQYFLSSSPEVSVHQIPLALADGGRRASADIAKGEALRPTDRVYIPSNIIPGEYYLALILDPGNELEELDKSNNRYVFPQKVVIEPPAFQIFSDRLPRATVGTPYSHPLVAGPAPDHHQWSATNLPPGIVMGSDGVLSGVPTVEGTFAFTAQVVAGSWRAERVIAFQVLSGSTPLEITTRSLPTAIRHIRYAGFYDRTWEREEEGVQLAASGGKPPYRWALDPEVEDNQLPEGLEGPSAEGRIRGTPTRFADSGTFHVQVTDSLGRVAKASLEITVLDEDSLAPPGGAFPSATTGREYDGCVEARGGTGAYRWEVDASTLPPGLEAEGRGARLCLVGTPKACGQQYQVLAQVEDERDQRRAALVTLDIECGHLQLDVDELRPVRRGEVVDIQLNALPSNQPRFRLQGGRLPDGLILEEDGNISGTVSPTAGFEAYDSIIELWDADGRRSLSAMTMQVVIEEMPLVSTTKKKPGCSSGSGGLSGLYAVGFAAWAGLSRRRRREARPSEKGAGDGGGLPGGSGTRHLGLLAAGLIAGAAAFACGDQITTTSSRCTAVSCDENFICDESDGHCKCGGVTGMICEEGARCRLQPEPHCIAPTACEFVQCERGHQCEPWTGECLCGDIECGENEFCVGGICKAEGLCDDVTCDNGMDCDPTDGVCKCDGVICSTGAECVEAQCVDDRCYGVTCEANSFCNQVDGVCHCGTEDGDICNLGQSCVGEEGVFICVDRGLCDEVVCRGGTTCDPEDGECRCGGVGPEYPTCEPGQSCLDGVCHGGDLCKPDGIEIVCSDGFTCDPGDGICKCGGEGGVICDEATESCLISSATGGRPTCAKTCTPLEIPDSCAPGTSCYYADGPQVCLTTGSTSLGEDCTRANQCEPGLYCHRGGKCSRLCDLEFGSGYCSSISPELECSPFEVGKTLGYCRGP